MYVISNKAWREAVELLTAYYQSEVSPNDLRKVNRLRRAKVLVRMLKKSKKI